MLAEDDASYRVRLEGRAELLDKTRLRYRALKDMLGSLTWRRRLRRNVPLLREIISVQPRVDEALGQVERKTATEGWDPASDIVRCAREVDDLKNLVWRQMGRKLEGTAGHTFSQRLEQLERLAVAGPRRVYPGERWKAALEALPGWLPELKPLESYGALLEALFKRPYLASQRLPFTPQELTRLELVWAEGESALASAWERVSIVDTTDGVQRTLRRRARSAPMKTPSSGPELMLRAEFWRTLALAKLREITTDRIASIQLTDAELLPVVRWLGERELGRSVPLQVSPPARAAIIELSAEFWLATRSTGADPHFWDRLYDQAQRAEHSLGDDADFGRLRDNIRLFLVMVSAQPSRRPLERKRPTRPMPTTLPGMVAEMRARLMEKV